MAVLFIVNPAAGKGKAKSLIPAIERVCVENDVEYEITETRGPGDAVNISRAASQRGFTTIVSVGGDGTLNEVVNGIAGSSIALGVIPGGSGNDFVRNVDNRRSADEALIDIIKGQAKKVDLGICNGRYFINVASVGLDAEVAERTERARRFFSGTAAYIAAVINTIFTYNGKRITVEMDDKTLSENTLLVAVANGKYYGGGMIPAPEADIRDGYFDICHVKQLPKPKILMLFPKFMKGRHGSIQEVSFHRSKKVVISSEESLAINIDGEIIKGNSITFEIVEKAINVVFPRE